MFRGRGRQQSVPVLVCVGLVALAGCKALNASFGDAETGTDGGDGGGAEASTDESGPTDDSKGTGGESESDSAEDSTVGGPGSMTSGRGTSADTEADTGADSVGEPSSTGGAGRTCDPYEGPLVNNVWVDSAVVPCPGVTVQDEALIVMRGEVLEIVACETCPQDCAGALLEIDLDASVDVPISELPDCVRVVLWGSEQQADPCEWEGMSLTDSDENPLFVVSDRLGVPAAAGGMLATMVDPVACDGSCVAGAHPGHYGLMMGADPVASGDVGEAGILVEGDLDVGIFENRSTVVSPDCETGVSWILDFVSPP